MPHGVVSVSFAGAFTVNSWISRDPCTTCWNPLIFSPFLLKWASKSKQEWLTSIHDITVSAGRRTGWHGSHAQQGPAVWTHLLSKTKNLQNSQITMSALKPMMAVSMQKTCQKLCYVLKGMASIQTLWQLPIGQHYSFVGQRHTRTRRHWAVFLQFPHLLLTSQALPILPEEAPLIWMDQLPGQICLSTCRAATLAAATSHHHYLAWGWHSYRHIVSTFPPFLPSPFCFFLFLLAHTFLLFTLSYALKKLQNGNYKHLVTVISCPDDLPP